MHNSNYPQTKHAQFRIAQRGICPEALELLRNEGLEFPEREGCVCVQILDRQVTELHECGYPMSVIAKALRIRAIFNANGVLITCYNCSRKSAFRGRLSGRKAAKVKRIMKRG